jgi:hypothetical protein
MDKETLAVDPSVSVLNEGSSSSGRAWLCLIAVLLIIVAALLVNSQSRAFTDDEGYHLLAAQLIRAGARPYLDFCFPQTPLNAYLNAAWMCLFGDTWRAVHVLAALETSGAVLLSAWFVLVRFPVRAWRFPGAVTTALLIGLNVLVVRFGPIGQAYAICLLLTVGAFYAATVSVERPGFALAALSGLLAGGAAASSLLAFSAGWVLVIWIFLYNQVGNRLLKTAAFIAGAVIPFVPVVRLFVQGPRQVWFNIFQYEFLYRQVHWPGATGHDFEVLTGWVNNSQAMLLLLLAVAGLVFLARQSEWDLARRRELYLCAVLALALGIQNAFAHPTFRQYFIFVVPFVAIVANLGLYSILLKFGLFERPLRPILGIALLLSLQVARALYDERNWVNWLHYEKVAGEVDEITPPGGILLADTQVYFLTRRRPPWGMELSDSHKLSLPPELNALFHLIPQAELERQINAGAFGTIQMCDEDMIDNLELEDMYERRFDFPTGDPFCSVFSGLKTGGTAGTSPER